MEIVRSFDKDFCGNLVSELWLDGMSINVPANLENL
jgi:hypothetical protein